jgi:hypothetical protein
MKHIILLFSLTSLLCACSLVKTREEVKEEQKAAAAEEEPGPIEDKVINDSLAEMGVDPEGGNPNATPEPEDDETGKEADAMEPAEVASTVNNVAAEPPAAKATAKPKLQKKKKTTSKKTVKKKKSKASQ